MLFCCLGMRLRSRWNRHGFHDVEVRYDRHGARRCLGVDDNSVGVAAFDRVGAMSRRNEDYSMTPAPFDKNRDGLVMGEGAAVIVLETEEHAKARRATIYAELAGYAATADAFHVTAPHESGEGGAAAIRQALASAHANADDIGYINAHGTATQLNDLSETKAVKGALGQTAYKIPIPPRSR